MEETVRVEWRATALNLEVKEGLMVEQRLELVPESEAGWDIVEGHRLNCPVGAVGHSER